MFRITLARFVLCVAFCSGCLNAGAAGEQEWTALWITHPTVPLRESAVLHFRRSLHLDQIPSHYIVHVSADNRFILYVNGQRIGDGPSRGDLAHWRYETYDLAGNLTKGDNLITATVWNFGIYSPQAQISDRTAFVLQGGGAFESAINTPTDWSVEIEHGQSAVPRKPGGLAGYMANGPGELLDASKYDWQWNSPVGGSGREWVAAASPMRENIYGGAARAAVEGTQADNFWQLVPDTLPHMEFTPSDAGHIVRSDPAGSQDFPEHPATIPAHSHVHLLLDRGTLTTGYPKLVVSQGRESTITLTYAEALYDANGKKGDRDEVRDRQANGFQDTFLPDGGAHRSFEPLWWRCWRFLDLDIQTGNEPLALESLTATFSAYPFKERASFQSDDATLKRIWDISWRTARLDAHETYMDTPYWEQLQYIGDTRLQALISYSVAGDDRLARQALSAFDQSRIPLGITQSRYPTSQPQLIPTFSLLWIGMLHDYWMYRPDPAPVKDSLEGTRDVLHWFSQYEQQDGLLRELPWWSFVDWVLSGKIPSYDAAGESCTTTLGYLGALDDAAEMERSLGSATIAIEYSERSKHIRKGIYEKCWDAGRKLLADNPSHSSYSQQTNSLGVLYDVIPPSDQRDVMERMRIIEPGTAPAGVLSSSLYFRFYLARALDHAGLADEYLSSLDPWRELLPLHFSTWPESPGDTRSDSHAWSAHPSFDLLTLVAGIEPASAGFATVKIAPHLGDLRKLSATYPHPKGDIAVTYERRGKDLSGTIVLPDGLSGTYVWGGKSQPLHAGKNQIGEH